tara:strand:- start:109 stop:312 length:204 start_codon:yes stop_codon:yes gene_type:complete
MPKEDINNSIIETALEFRDASRQIASDAMKIKDQAKIQEMIVAKTEENQKLLTKLFSLLDEYEAMGK